MDKEPSIRDVQNYFLSFFGCIEAPTATETEKIKVEVKEDINNDR